MNAFEHHEQKLQVNQTTGGNTTFGGVSNLSRGNLRSQGGARPGRGPANASINNSRRNISLTNVQLGLGGNSRPRTAAMAGGGLPNLPRPPTAKMPLGGGLGAL